MNSSAAPPVTNALLAHPRRSSGAFRRLPLDSTLLTFALERVAETTAELLFGQRHRHRALGVHAQPVALQGQRAGRQLRADATLALGGEARLTAVEPCGIT